jgi:hypothetical protein
VSAGALGAVFIYVSLGLICFELRKSKIEVKDNSL